MTFQILLVDDEPHVVDAIHSILEQNAEVELEIRSAYRGQQALKLCEQFPINLLITDIRMPDMSGLELARKAKQINPDCEVILLTAHSDFDYAYEGLRLHAADYILKTEESSTTTCFLSFTGLRRLSTPHVPALTQAETSTWRPTFSTYTITIRT